MGLRAVYPDVMLHLVVLLVLAQTRGSGNAAIQEEARQFRTDTLQARAIYASDRAGALKMVRKWEEHRTYRATARYTELMLVAGDDRARMNYLIKAMGRDRYGFSHFNLAKFALLPPAVARQRKGFMQLERLLALRLALDHPTPEKTRGPQRKDRELVGRIETYDVACDAYLRMGQWPQALRVAKLMRADVRRIKNPKWRKSWTDISGYLYRDAVAKVPPKTSPMP